MLEALRLHTFTHLRFFARSRLLLGLALVLGGVWALGLIAFMLIESSGDRFDMLRMISGQLRWFAWFFTAAMGLFALWWHTNARTTSLVFTRPGRPEYWLASIFCSAFLAAVAIHTAGLLLTLGLSLAWNIPFQSGFLWLSLDGIFESMIMVSVLTGLAAAIHPALAVIAMMFFSEGMFYWFNTMLLGYIEANGSGIWIGALQKGVSAVHKILPMLDPFAERTREIESTVRASGADWAYLAGTATYALLVFAFWFLFADYRLRRRALS